MAKHLDLLAVSPELPSTLHLRFADGACMRLDVARLIADLPPVFAALRDPDTFMRASTGDRFRGRGVWWPDSWALTIDVHELRAQAIHQATGRGPGWVIDWMARNRLTVAAAAEALGVSRRMVVHYRSAQKPIPRKVVLAIEGWSKQLQSGGPATACAPDALRQWLTTHGHTLSVGAQALGVSRRMLAYYLSGEKPIPRRVALAMVGWRG